MPNISFLDHVFGYRKTETNLSFCVHSRISVCFVVVACSDATLMLRALVLPFRLWYFHLILCLFL